MALIKCPECGKEVCDTESKCLECGKVFEEENTKETLREGLELSEDSANDGGNETLSESSGENVNQVTEEKSEEAEKTSDDKSEQSVSNAIQENTLLSEEPNESLQKNDIEMTVEKKKKGIKPGIIASGILVVITIVCLVYAVKISGKYNALSKDYASLSVELKDMEDRNKTLLDDKNNLLDEVAQLKAENDELANGAKKQLSDVRNAYEKGEWQKTIDLADALHVKYNGSEEDKEAQEMAKASQARLDEAAAAKAAEEAKGYETGITYDQLARTPDDYMGKKVKFSGKVIQVIEGDDSVQIRLAVNNDYDTVLFGEYSSNTVSSRVLEEDQITIYGTSVGTISYKSTMGGQITIPGVYIDKIDQ